MGKYIIIMGLLILMGGFLGCGSQNFCQDARGILEGCNNDEPTGINGTSMSFLNGLISGPTCMGSTECVSRCVVDNPDGACQFQNHDEGDSPDMEDESGNPNNDSPELHSFEICVGGCFLGGGII